MSFMMSRRCVAGLVGVLLLVGVVSLNLAGESNPTKTTQGDTTARQATFEVRHELKVMVPEGAQRVRVWFVLPQEDPIPGDGTASAQRVSRSTDRRAISVSRRARFRGQQSPLP